MNFLLIISLATSIVAYSMYSHAFNSMPATIARNQFSGDGVFTKKVKPFHEFMLHVIGLVIPIHLWIYLFEWKWYLVIPAHVFLMFVIKDLLGYFATSILGRKNYNYLTDSYEVSAFRPMSYLMIVGFVSYLFFLIWNIFQ